VQLLVLAAAGPALTAFVWASPCQVRGRSVVVSQVTIAPAGSSQRFTLGLSGVAAAVTPAGAQPRSRLEVAGALAFSAQVATPDIPYRIAAPLPAADGVLRLSPELAVSTVTTNAAGLHIDVELAQGVVAQAVPVSCAALTLDPKPPAPSLPASTGTAAKAGPRRVLLARGDTLALYARPGLAPALRVALSAPVNLPLPLVDEQGDWLQVAAPLAGDGLLRGWVPARAVRPQRPSDVEFAVGRSFPLEPLELSGFGQGTNVRTGPARIALGTRVYAERGQGAWATVKTREPLPVRQVAGDDWAAILRVPGLRHSGDLIVAWVPVAAVRWEPP
jgi:hypothetical protein